MDLNRAYIKNVENGKQNFTLSTMEKVAKVLRVSVDQLLKTMSTQNKTLTKIAIFEKKEVRKILHKNKWWFSVIDLIEVLTNNNIPKRYWSHLMIKLKKEGFVEVYENIIRLKLVSPDSKSRD